MLGESAALRSLSWSLCYVRFPVSCGGGVPSIFPTPNPRPAAARSLPAPRHPAAPFPPQNLGVGVYDLLPGVDNPMLLVGGSEDGLVPPQNLQIMAAELGPKVALWVYPNTRHGVIQQNTDSVLALVEAFLSQYGG